MIEASLKRAPYVSLRHARIGRIGAEGSLPPGWRGQHIGEVTVLDVNLSEARPSVVVNLKFAGDIGSAFVGLCVGPYLPVADDAVVVLEADVTLAGWDNIDAGFMIVREWREGGELMGQSRRPLALREGPQSAVVTHAGRGEGRLAEPVVTFRRREAAPGSLTVTLKGLAFGSPSDSPGGFWT